MNLFKISACLMAFALFACDAKKSGDTESAAVETAHAWTEADLQEFEINCIGLLEAEAVEGARGYCDCLLETTLTQYPDPEVAMELEQHHIVEMFEQSDCIDDLLLVKIEHPWTEEAEQLFLEQCISGQVAQGISEDAATSYCSCALDEVRQIIPNPQHVLSLTAEELNHVFETCKGESQQ